MEVTQGLRETVSVNMNILDKLRNAKPGSYVDIRSPDNQVDSFPVSELQQLLERSMMSPERKYVQTVDGKSLTSRDLQDLFSGE